MKAILLWCGAILAMALAAYLMTVLVLFPTLPRPQPAAPSPALTPDTPPAEVEAAAATATAESPKTTQSGPGESPKWQVQFDEVRANLAGTEATRIVFAKFTVACATEADQGTVEENRDRLIDVAVNVLSSRVLDEFDQPDFRRRLRSEFVKQFNKKLRCDAVADVYFTLLATQ